jgi:hypothetical protein
MNGDILELARLINESERKVSDNIRSLVGEVGELRGTVTTGLQSTNQRVSDLEEINDREETRHWVKISVVIPVMLAIHKALTALGFKI